MIKKKSIWVFNLFVIETHLRSGKECALCTSHGAERKTLKKWQRKTKRVKPKSVPKRETEWSVFAWNENVAPPTLQEEEIGSTKLLQLPVFDSLIFLSVSAWKGFEKKNEMSESEWVRLRVWVKEWEILGVLVLFAWSDFSVCNKNWKICCDLRLRCFWGRCRGVLLMKWR